MLILSRYNGTARGLQNCNEGGCPRCNGTTGSPDASFECVCLHAEENALLEAGRERVGTSAVLYCNTSVSHGFVASSDIFSCSCPCLRCTVKIIQTGVKLVVYNLTYKVSVTGLTLYLIIA